MTLVTQIMNVIPVPRCQKRNYCSHIVTHESNTKYHLQVSFAPHEYLIVQYSFDLTAQRDIPYVVLMIAVIHQNVLQMV